jgi:ribonuclease J
VSSEPSSGHREPPPTLAEGSLRIVALGGIGEVGRNMTLVETTRGSLVVDCGVLFPSNDLPGVDYILPDFGPMASRAEGVRAILLTHGHEDHIGGVAHFLKQVRNVPVYGSGFTLALLREKLAEAKVKAVLIEVREGETHEIDPFECEFLAVNHSVPDGLAISLRFEDLHVFHTGDFKLDQQPLDGRLTDLAGFAALGRRGIDILLSDSTNADVPGYIPDEVDVAPNFLHIFEETPGRVLVASFASHVHRVQQVINCARDAGRKVALVGRSMERNMRVARQAGLLDVPDDLLIPAAEMTEVAPEKLVVACTGSQGEPTAVLARLARGDHRLRVDEGDVVIFSARLIPGNEVEVFRVINALSERGIKVLHGGNADIHASGHAPAGELRQVLNLTKPRHLLPAHGEWRHIRAHAEIARSIGLTEEQILFAPNGTVVDLDTSGARVVGHEHIDSIMVDTTSVGLVDSSMMRDRRVMGSAGSLIILGVIDLGSGSVGRPRLELKGMERSEEWLARAADVAQEALESVIGLSIADQQTLVRSRVTKWLRSEHRRVPLIVPIVVHVGAAEVDDSDR